MAVLSVVSALLAVFAVSRILNFYKYDQQTGKLPGLRSLLTPISTLGASFPTSRFNPGLNWQWEWREEVYKRAGTETISSLPYLFGAPAIYTSSLDVARQVVSTKGDFYKAADITAITMIWGPNVFAANADEWRRHRRVLTPAFDNTTNAAVWQQTARVFDEMVTSEGLEAMSRVDIPVVNDLTYNLALILISTCGFGNPIPWNFKGKPGGEMSFGEALYAITRNSLMFLLVPRWMFRLPIAKLQKLERAMQTVLVFMRELIDTRRAELASGPSEYRDILSLMIQSENSDDKYSMTDSELIGNTFLLLSAGHDTTARTLDAALGFLGLHEDFQEEVYREVMEIMPTDVDFTFENSSRLKKVEACFLEASRLFPAGFMLIRDTAEDIILRNLGPNRDQSVPIPAGTRCVVDTIGLHYNPRLFPDPESFKPERWYGAHENQLTMFSVGPRACPGRRFAITEGVCFLARLLRMWKVEILANEGETKAQWRARVMRGVAFTNFGVGDVPVRLVRRM